MPRIAVLSANLGSYDQPTVWPDLEVPVGSTVDVHRFTDDNFPPRTLAMTSRLQCGIPKWFPSDFVTADVTIWIDASCAPTPMAVPWFLERIGAAEIAVFKHPERATIREEYEFMKARMARPGETYLNSRYRGERLDEQYQAIVRAGHQELPLYASTAFACRSTTRVRAALADVFLMKARYLLHDQLAFPHALRTHGCAVHVIPDNYLKCEALQFTRRRRREIVNWPTAVPMR